ncbi:MULTISPECIES: hypothetical protein [Providencia]|uniref:hypothetical protein n=1 Tax=Providencia TaxID=586 RepID=UPI00234BC6DD|nr:MULTISPECIES: hypothetical protein [unclassified Providencia]
MKMFKREVVLSVLLLAGAFSSSAIAEKVSLTKPFICPDVSPLPQKVTENGNLIIDGKTYYLHNPNAAHPSAKMTTTIWVSKDGKTEIDIYQHNNGEFRQAFISFSVPLDQLPLSDEKANKYMTLYKDSYSDGGRGCSN